MSQIALETLTLQCEALRLISLQTMASNVPHASAMEEGVTYWLIKWYIPFACLRPWWHYTTLLDTAVKVTTWGFWAKKLPEGPMLYFVMQTLLQLLVQKFYFTWSNPWSSLRSDPRSNLWFNPVQSRFCWCHKLKVILGRFRTF